MHSGTQTSDFMNNDGKITEEVLKRWLVSSRKKGSDDHNPRQVTMENSVMIKTLSFSFEYDHVAISLRNSGDQVYSDFGT